MEPEASRAETGVPSAAEMGTPPLVCLSEPPPQRKANQTSPLDPNRVHGEMSSLEN